MHPTTRLRILDYLRKHHTASAADLSRFLGMTGANIRHHLAVLETNQLVEVIAIRHQGRGRPEQVYGLSRHVLGDGLDDLATAMFAEWLRTLSPARQDAALQRIAARLADNAAAAVGPLPRRLTEAIARLNDLHYQPRWEAGAVGPKVILGHCPYVAILGRVPEICRLDALLLETLLKMPVQQVMRIEPDSGGWQCVFQVHGHG